MKIAIDLDGTAWDHPQFFKAMLKDLKCEIGILTAHDVALYEKDMQLWRARGYPDINFFINRESQDKRSAAEWKVEMLFKHNIDCLFDDFDMNPEYEQYVITHKPLNCIIFKSYKK